ncbi:hypothetical protein [Mycolicibacterium fortuitum]|uniref:hypothetical protein n=1 Tax=Mycolicibacterium fortuitum TaxID=1766 RepID=UPI0007EBFB7A|nr:hypothetical protein [Mycolicibacterium fortuitum]OBF77011.1 hypothetical protein A5751_22790 [Mycolicibacterium fortuitum]
MADNYTLSAAAQILSNECAEPYSRLGLLKLLESYAWVRRGRRNCWTATPLAISEGYLCMVSGGFYFRNGQQREGRPVVQITPSGLAETKRRIDILGRIPGRAEHSALIP